MRILIVAGSIVSIGVAIVVTIVALQILQYSQPQWPSIDDPTLLIRDCSTVIEGDSTGPLPKHLWPKSIQKLTPLEVMVTHQHCVEIVISTGGIGPRYSYFVFADQNLAKGVSIHEVTLHKTANPRLFKVY